MVYRHRISLHLPIKNYREFFYSSYIRSFSLVILAFILFQKPYKTSNLPLSLYVTIALSPFPSLEKERMSWLNLAVSLPYMDSSGRWW